MSSHEEMRFEVAAYLAGRLPADARRRMEAHLETCRECGDLAEDLRGFGIALAVDGEALFEDHPGPDELTRYADGRAATDRGRLERHLAVCATCQLEVEVRSPLPAGRAPGVARAAAAPRGRIRRLVEALALLAAGIVIGVLLAPILRTERGFSGGPIRIPVLARPTRGAAAPTRILVRPGQPAVVLAIPFDPPKDRPDDEILAIEVRGEAGVAYATRSSLGSLRRRLDASGVLTLLVEGRRLPPGSYQVSVTGASGAQDALALLSFDVVRSDGE